MRASSQGVPMASRSLPLMSAVFCLIPGFVLAQAPSPAPPPAIDQALRARATEFFQDFVDKKYRQALELVADDTQDEYFSSTKAELKGFSIDSIAYRDNFTDATVKIKVKQVLQMKAEGFL